MPKVSAEHLQARRGQILDAARRCFARNGFHETTMQDLFAESGLSAGAVYRYFPSKNDVVVAVAQDNLRAVAELINQLAEDPNQTSLGDCISAILRILKERHDTEGLGDIAVLVWSEALRHPGIGDRFRELAQQLTADLTALISRYQPGSARPTSQSLAGLLMALIPGYILQLSLFGGAATDDIVHAVEDLWST